MRRLIKFTGPRASSRARTHARARARARSSSRVRALTFTYTMHARLYLASGRAGAYSLPKVLECIVSLRSSLSATVTPSPPSLSLSLSLSLSVSLSVCLSVCLFLSLPWSSRLAVSHAPYIYLRRRGAIQNRRIAEQNSALFHRIGRDATRGAHRVAKGAEVTVRCR